MILPHILLIHITLIPLHFIRHFESDFVLFFATHSTSTIVSFVAFHTSEGVDGVNKDYQDYQDYHFHVDRYQCQTDCRGGYMNPYDTQRVPPMAHNVPPMPHYSHYDDFRPSLVCVKQEPRDMGYETSEYANLCFQKVVEFF